jgi:hypothetical protein
MTPAEVAKLLAKAAAYDQRTIGQAHVMAWHEVLSDFDLADSLTAVSRHYAEHTERLMPAHVRRLATEIDRERRRLAREQREESERLAIEADPSRRDRSAEVRALIAELRDSLPDGDPDKLRRPEVLEWERQRAREAAEGPNPAYDPTVHARLAEEAP